jgi:hypothetical protein
MRIESVLTCPQCGFPSAEPMPVNFVGCGQKFKPLAGDCCVFCSFSSAPCPPVQGSGKTRAARDDGSGHIQVTPLPSALVR